jgi:hypothetical protein
VVLDSTFSHGPGASGNDVPPGSTYLARSSGNTTAWDNVAVVRCSLDSHVDPAGWAYEIDGQPRSNPATSTAASGWREYRSQGPAGDMTHRKSGYALSAAEVESGFSTRAQMFAGNDNGAGWNPIR